MRSDIIKSMKLLPYGVSATLNLVLAGVYFAAGLAMEWMSAFLAAEFNGEEFFFIPVGAVFLSCIMMMPTQLLMSQTLASMVGASPYGRRLKISMPVALSAVWSVFIMTVLVIMKLVETALVPQNADYIWKSLLFFAVVQALIMIYTTFVYRYFAVSLVVLYVVMLALGLLLGVSAALEDSFLGAISAAFPTFGHPAVYIVLSYLILAVSVGIWYLLSKLLYKQPLSKYAFGAAIRKMG